MKLNIDLGKYVITGTKHDLILSERGILKEGENAGKETLSRIGYYSKFEHLVKEGCLYQNRRRRLTVANLQLVVKGE
ncbi:hypothetical protein [Escherichia coli]|uniref:hypothetical protein n=1 Tax=Escherichia coli TaxID=562 RepID=UPI000B7E780D|nr:hypothetical protein [Escherichia coli]